MLTNAKRKPERTTELQPLRPLTVYPKLPSLEGRMYAFEEKQGRPLMAQNALEIKVNQLYQFIEDFEASVPFDEDVQWRLDCIRDHAHGLCEIVEDYHHFSERAA